MGFWTTPRFSRLDLIGIGFIASLLQSAIKFWF